MVDVDKNRTMLILLVVALFVMAALPAVSAGPFSTVFAAEDNEILPNETAAFTLTINNFDTTPQRFQVYSIDPNWVTRVSPPSVVVPAEESAEFTVSFKPKSNVNYGSQGISVNVKNLETGDVVKKTLFVAVKSFDSTGGTYAASVAFDISFPEPVDPRQPLQMTVHLRNRNALDINDMTMKITSPHLAKEEMFDLDPLGEKTEYYRFDLDPLEVPGEYELHGVLLHKGAKVSEVTKTYDIASYSHVTENLDKSRFLCRTEKVVTLHNIGNVEASATAAIPSNFFARLFSTTDARYSEYDNGKAFVWDVTLAPDETRELVLVENYRWIVVVFLIILVTLILYLFHRSPIVSLKEAVGIKHGEGVSEIKIRIFIKNRVNKVVQGVEVLDKVPSIAELTKTHALGTIKPTKVTRLKSGTLLRWELDLLEPYEERILTYSLKSRLKIVGKLNLPQSKIKFETKKGQERVVYSNNLLFVEKE